MPAGLMRCLHIMSLTLHYALEQGKTAGETKMHKGKRSTRLLRGIIRQSQDQQQR